MLNRLFGLMLSIGATVVGVHSVNPNFPKTNQAIVAPTRDIDALDIALPDLKPCPTHYTKKKSISSKKKAHRRKSKMSHRRKSEMSHHYHLHKHHHSHRHHPRHHRIPVHMQHHHAPHTGPPGCH